MRISISISYIFIVQLEHFSNAGDLKTIYRNQYNSHKYLNLIFKI